MASAVRFSDVQNSAEVLDRLIETVAKQPEKPSKWTFTQWALLVILVIIIGTWLLGLFLNIFGREIKRIDIWDVAVIGSNALCPGEKLTISFKLYADGTGKLVEDATVWVEVPPKTAIYSETRPLLVDGLLEQEQIIAWEVPQTFVDPATLEEAPLPAGPYRRIFSISSATDEGVFALDRVLFEIREDCE
jgi:hypothetical protein